MTPTTLFPISMQIKEMVQLVLFPEFFGVCSLPLEQCRGDNGPTQQEEREGGLHQSFQKALAAGQMLLW